MQIGGSSDSLPQPQFEAPRSHFASHQQSAQTLNQTQLRMNLS